MCVVLGNPCLKGMRFLASHFYSTRDAPAETFITRTDLENLARVTGFEVVRLHLCGYVTWSLSGFGNILNRVLPALPVPPHVRLFTSSGRDYCMVVLDAVTDADELERMAQHLGFF